jgi:hypothetical protein
MVIPQIVLWLQWTREQLSGELPETMLVVVDDTPFDLQISI